MKIILTGCAGFIGYHLAKKYLDMNFKVLGIDNLNSYYNIKLKKDRLKNLYKHKNSKNFFFKKISIGNYNNLNKVFSKFKPSVVVNLAAQAGVRYVKKNSYAMFF